MIFVQVAMSLTLLLMFVAIVADGGMWMIEQRRMQAAADAAALAAANVIYENWLTDNGRPTNDTVRKAKDSATATATANGFTEGVKNTTVTINIPPVDPAFSQHQTNGYAMVTITRNESRYFSNVFGKGAVPITVRAVARGRLMPLQPDIIALHPSAGLALNLLGTGTLTLARGGIQVNSNSDAALFLAGGIVRSDEVKVVGHVRSSGSFRDIDDIVTSPKENADPLPDPFSHIPEPPVPGSAGRKRTTGPNKYELDPGVFDGNPSLDFKPGDTVIFNSGVYYLRGGSFSSVRANLAVAEGRDGILIFNGGVGSILIEGTNGGAVNLRSPISGPQEGIVIFQRRTSNQPITIIGDGVFDIEGSIYAAGGRLDITGRGNSSVIGAQLIASTIQITRIGDVFVDYYGGRKARVRDIRLVE
jgi:hypothetical protein